MQKVLVVADLRNATNAGIGFQTLQEVLSDSILQEGKAKEMMQMRLDSLRKHLTAFTNQGEVVNALTHEIRLHKVRLISLKPGKILSQEELDILPIAIQASGSFDDVCRLIYSLESKGGNYQIRSFAQKQNKKNGTLTELELALDVIIHRQREHEKPV